MSDPELFRDVAGRWAATCCCATARSATLAERANRRRTAGSVAGLRVPRRKMFRSAAEPAEIDYLYSELVCVAW